MSKYFSPDFLKFFKELAANNDREWFLAQKKRYEAVVKEPFEYFVTDFIKMAATIDPPCKVCSPKQSIFRIYRDIRFSKDKTPYKIYASAAISPDGGKKDMITPGYYLELGPEHVRVYSGIYAPDTATILKVRKFLKKNVDTASKLLKDKKFIAMFGEMRGEKNKIIPPEFRDTAEKLPILYNKQWYFYAERPASLVTKETLLKELETVLKTALPMVQFFRKAIK